MLKGVKRIFREKRKLFSLEFPFETLDLVVFNK
jgi:hypothetical protein